MWLIASIILWNCFKMFCLGLHTLLDSTQHYTTGGSSKSCQVNVSYVLFRIEHASTRMHWVVTQKTQQNCIYNCPSFFFFFFLGGGGGWGNRVLLRFNLCLFLGVFFCNNINLDWMTWCENCSRILTLLRDKYLKD